MSDQTVAKTILEQLGGPRFVVITGANTLTGHKDGLGMRVNGKIAAGKIAAGKVNYVKITLDPSDTYTVESSYVRGTTITPRYKVSDIYCDSLQDAFEAATGLFVTLNRRS